MTRRLLWVLVLLGLTGVVVGVPPGAWSADPPAAAVEALHKVNINTATAAELTALPGIGETIARAVVEYRDNNGAYRSVEDLLPVKGIGEKRLAVLRDLVSLQ